MIRGLGISVLVVGTLSSSAARAEGAPLDHSKNTAEADFLGFVLPTERQEGSSCPGGRADAKRRAHTDNEACTEVTGAGSSCLELPIARRLQQAEPEQDQPAQGQPKQAQPAQDAEEEEDEDEYEHEGAEEEEEEEGVEEAQPGAPPAGQPGAAEPPAAEAAPAPEEPPAVDEAPAPAEPEAVAPPIAPAGPEAGQIGAEEEEFRDTGYIPGYKRWPSLGLSPHAPKQPHPYFGGITPAFGAPTDEGSWRFDFNGNLTARYSVGLDGSVEDDGLAFYIPPRRELPYQRGVRANLRFVYASPYVEAHVGYWSWLTGKEWEGIYRPGRNGSGFFDASALFILPELGDWLLNLRAGAFSTTFGGPHKWTWGIYGPLAAIRGYGYEFRGTWDVNPEWDVEVRQAFITMPKVPEDFPLGGYTNWGTTGQTSFAHAWNAGVIYDSKYFFRGTLVSAFAHELRPGRNTFDADDGKDGRYDIWIAEGHWLEEFFGEYNLSYSYNNLVDAEPVHGGIWWSQDWTQGATDMLLVHIGPAARGTGTFHVISWEIDYSIRRLIDQDFYDPQASDVLLNIASIYTWTGETRDRAFRGKKLLWFATDVEYRILSWFGTRFIWRFADPDLRLANDYSQVFAPGVTFRSDWDSPDVIDLTYKYYHRPEGFVINPNAPDIKHVIELNASVTW